jgi:four helix bundle protein
LRRGNSPTGWRSTSIPRLTTARSERYELTAQVRRAVLSIPTNIAEGSTRHGPREFRRFLDIAIGSLAELSYLILFARDRGLLRENEWNDLDIARDRVGKGYLGPAAFDQGRKLPADTVNLYDLAT